MSPSAPSCILPRVAMTISFWTLCELHCAVFTRTKSVCVVSASSSLFLLMCCFHSSTLDIHDETVWKHRADKLWSRREHRLVIGRTRPTGLSRGELLDPNYCLFHF
ncbi:hypothetical protein C8R43DRAFT_1035362 [Mycena crocata]|nr:hypothetical protein C8R43DRAFT_1035362 [Mycena crocata]